MKRVGNLWPQLVSFENLLASAMAAARGKRKRPDVARFLLNLEPELASLRRELESGGYAPGEYREFEVRDPKPRTISAAPFRDRVVHHALTRVLEPVFEPRFSAHSYACRKGMGTHAAVEAARRGAHNHEFAFKGDVMKYFASIDHEILLEQLARAVKCRHTLALAASIIAGWEDRRVAASYFEGDDLFAPHERRRGLPLGNQTSQFFANVYLTPLDVIIEQELRPARYARYVDDFLLFGNCKSELNDMRARIEEALAAVRLRIHPGKSRAYRTHDGVSFLGWIVFPERVRLNRRNVVCARRRFRSVERSYAEGRMAWLAVESRFRGWLAHAAHGDTWRLRTETMARYNLTVRSAV